MWGFLAANRQHVIQTIIIVLLVPLIVAVYLYFLGQRDDVNALKVENAYVWKTIQANHEADLRSYKDMSDTLNKTLDTVLCIRIKLNGGKTCD